MLTDVVHSLQQIFERRSININSEYAITRNVRPIVIRNIWLRYDISQRNAKKILIDLAVSFEKASSEFYSKCVKIKSNK